MALTKFGKFAVIGGDTRFKFTAKRLSDAGFEVTAAVDCKDLGSALAEAQYILLPIPWSRDEGKSVYMPFSETPLPPEQLISRCRTGCTVFCGMASPELTIPALRKNITVCDYSEREEFQIANAVPTAEGALAAAMSETGRTIAGSSIAVIGFGRVGKACARLFAAVNSNVTATARKPSDIAWISAEGFRAARTPDFASYLPYADIIINTVAQRIINRDELALLKKDAVIIDLASKPGGVDLSAAKELGIRVVWALSLPGKVAPETAGVIIAETVMNILTEKSVSK